MARPKPYWADQPDPATRTCEFCEQAAAHAVPLVKGGEWLFACDAHHDHARQSVIGKRQDPRADGPRGKRSQDERLFTVPAAR